MPQDFEKSQRELEQDFEKSQSELENIALDFKH